MSITVNLVPREKNYGICKCTGKSVAYIRKHLLQQSDCFFSPDEAVTHGIVDEVIKNP